MAPPRLPLLMGVVNATPDSFSDGGRYGDPARAVDHALRLVDEGADIVDVGGESTRPGARPVDPEEELGRVLPVLRGIAARSSVRLSIDTRRPEVARAAGEAGATLWNDVSALAFSPGSLAAAAAFPGDVVLMHAQGPPETMQDDPRYDDVVEEVAAFLAARVAAAEAAGVSRARLVVDPGVGFGKTVDHNLALIAGLGRFGALGLPVLVGLSRKGFIGRLDAGAPADRRLAGSLAGAIEAWRRGASILRVHDVAETRQALRVAFAVLAAGEA